MEAVRINDWLICGNCGCKLAKIDEGGSCRLVTVKCHQCKNINNINVRRPKCNH